MSEHFPGTLKELEKLEHEHLLPEHQYEVLPEYAASGRPEKHPAEAVAEARAEIANTLTHNHAPSPLERLKSAENESQAPDRGYINSELRAMTRQRELRQIQRHETPLQRQFSKVIHQPAIRAVSEAAGKTVSRPSGLLGGGLTALLGTSTYLYLAKHIGFTYNYGIFLLLFVGGFLVGLGLELAVHAASSRDSAE